MLHEAGGTLQPMRCTGQPGSITPICAHGCLRPTQAEQAALVRHPMCSPGEANDCRGIKLAVPLICAGVAGLDEPLSPVLIDPRSSRLKADSLIFDVRTTALREGVSSDEGAQNVERNNKGCIALQVAAMASQQSTGQDLGAS